MGNNLSNHFINHNPVETQDFTFYEAGCEDDEDVQKFDNKMKARVGEVLAACTGDSQQLGLLKDVTTSMFDLTLDAVELILKHKDDVWKCKKLHPIVKDFFDNSLVTLRFCTATKSSVKSAKDFHSFLQSAIDRTPVDRVPNDQEVRSILGAVDLFCQAENPFGDVFIQKLEAVRKQHTSMLERLTDKKSKLDKRLNRVKIWSKVSSILFGATVAALLICSVLEAVYGVSPAVVPVASVSEAASSMGAWIKSLFRRYKEDIRAQREVVDRMRVATSCVIPVFGKIGPLAEDLKEKLTGITAEINLIGKHKELIALRLSMDNITTQNAICLKKLDEMQLHVDDVADRIRQARTTVLQFLDERTDERGFF